MSEQNLIEIAVRKKLRFPSPRGELTVEQLYSLPLTAKNEATANLNDIARTLAAEASTESLNFVEGLTPKKGSDASLKLDIVKYVIKTLCEERNARIKQASIDSKLSEALAVREARRGQAVANMTDEELDAYIKSLESGTETTS